MSEANLPAIHGPYRRKVTLACGSCRRRRVKCSGTQPCTLCSESGRQCQFDNSNRGRRGPRPRQPPAGQTERVIRPLAPWRPSSKQEQEGATSLTAVAAELASQPPEIGVAEETGIPILDDDNPLDDDGDDYDDGGSSSDESEMPDPSLWKPGLQKLLYSENSMSNNLPGLDISLVCHLLEMFCTRSNAQLKPLLSPAHIQQHLSEGTISRGLILAACASGLRFTVHREARGPQARLFAEGMAREARKSIQVSKIEWKQVDSVKVIIVRELADNYEKAMGRGLLQLARSHGDLGSEKMQQLSVAERYLAVAQVSHCLGHPSLQPPRGRPVKNPRLETQHFPYPSECPRLVELLEVLACIHELCSTPFKEQHPLPWRPESKFRALQDELEEYLLRHPETFDFESSSSPCHQRQDGIDASISSLIWHCCAIVLNRTFLPIPGRPEASAGGECEATLVPCLQFPGAPPLFLKERIYRCESSADAICEIARHIIRSGRFYSHALLVGFSCTQSALVSINRLHRSSKPYDEQIVENLKIAFITLKALKPIYSPAEDWMDVLFRAHDGNTRLTHSSETIDLAFDSYFSRFSDIVEPAFMPLDPKESHTTGDAEGVHQPTEATEQPDHGNAVESHGENQAAASDAGPEWLQAYAGHLSGDIDEDADMEANDKTSCNEAIHVMPAQTSAVAQAAPVLVIDTEQIQEPTNIAPGDLGSPVKMAGAILTSMSGRAPDPVMQTHDTQLGVQYGGEVPGSMSVDSGDMFSNLFGPMVSFPDVAGLDADMALFPELGSAVGDLDMWPYMFNQDMSR